MPLSTICSINTITGIKINMLKSAFISSANFASPSTLGSISIQNITGNYTSFTVSRTGGGLSNYTSSTQNYPINSFTDPTTLVNNAQYTYIITPTNNGVVGNAYSVITNLTTGLSNGLIYTLATTTNLSLARNDSGGNVNAISFTYTGTNNGTSNDFTSVSIQYPNGNQIANPKFVLGTNTFTTNVANPNTQYTHSVYVMNGDGLINKTTATITTCTWGFCTSAPSSILYTSHTMKCTGKFSKVNMTYSGAGTPSSGVILTGTNSVSQAFTSMTAYGNYTFNCYPINLLNYQSPNVGSVIFTLMDNNFTINSLTNFNRITDVTLDIYGNSVYYKFFVCKSNSVNYTINYTAITTSQIYILAVGGGGGGGSGDFYNNGGGGGGGGVVKTTLNVPAGSDTITVNVGAGGLGRLNSTGTNGSNTTVTFASQTNLNFTAYGGQAGDYNNSNISLPNIGPGGSGGGASCYNTSVYNIDITNQNINPSNFANTGGNGYYQLSTACSGGGGGGAGTGPTVNVGGYSAIDAGNGIQHMDLPGINQYTPYANFYWGGGGGAGTTTIGGSGKGGLGGGAGGGRQVGTNGGISDTTGTVINLSTSFGGGGSPGDASAGGNAGINSGGGGGGGGFRSGGHGGSGIVVIAFKLGN